jgi:hypothetical protein
VDNSGDPVEKIRLGFVRHRHLHLRARPVPAEPEAQQIHAENPAAASDSTVHAMRRSSDDKNQIASPGSWLHQHDITGRLHIYVYPVRIHRMHAFIV